MPMALLEMPYRGELALTPCRCRWYNFPSLFPFRFFLLASEADLAAPALFSPFFPATLGAIGKFGFRSLYVDFFELKYRQHDACSIYTNLNENSRIEYLKRFSADWLALPNTKNNSFPLARPPGCPLLCILLPNLCFDWHVSILGNQLACYKIDAGLCRDFKLNCISIASLQDFSPQHMELNHKQTNQLSLN